MWDLAPFILYRGPCTISHLGSLISHPLVIFLLHCSSQISARRLAMPSPSPPGRGPTVTLMLTAVVIATAVFPWTVLGQLTVTSGEDVCHLVTVNGNPNCVTDGEGGTVRSSRLRGILHRRASARPRPARTPPRTVGAAFLRSRFAGLPASLGR